MTNGSLVLPDAQATGICAHGFFAWRGSTQLSVRINQSRASTGHESSKYANIEDSPLPSVLCIIHKLSVRMCNINHYRPTMQHLQGRLIRDNRRPRDLQAPFAM